MDIRTTDDIIRLKVCVIVPTYNNDKTLKRVLDSILKYSSNIIVVNDGSTDHTDVILAGYPHLIQIHHARNAGKGLALRNGFQQALQLQYNYAITIDSDGQHFASDIPKFVSAIEAEANALLIGSRNMSQSGVPKKSSFGNNFSNFWFWFETGIRLDDTQSGFRMYPLHLIPQRYFTRKFEFEIEIIVRSAWRGVVVKNIPIQILYDPDERVSHFRPFKDFTRISILNTVFVLITIFYIKPRDIFRKLKRKGFRKFFAENILASDDSNSKKALSVALGVFIGIAPIWGFQTIVVLFFAVLFRLNKAISFAFSNISFPPLIPFIIYGSLRIGGLFIESDAPIFVAEFITWTDIKNHLVQYLVGSFILATVTALIFGFGAYSMLSLFSTFRNKK